MNYENPAESTSSSNHSEENNNNNTIDRRKFVGSVATAALAFSIVPRHVLGGKGYMAASDKITLAYIGTGTEGLREMMPLLGMQQIQVVAVCDPNRDAVGYRDWGKDYLKNQIRNTIKKPDWNPGGDNTIPGGRENGKNIVETYYANVRPELKYKGCAAYEDFRELLDKQKDLDSVKIMTPDHLHGVISIAAIKKG